MKHFVIYTIFILIAYCSFAQSSTAINNAQPPHVFDNIFVEKLESDSLSSSSIIWIKDSVRLHKHITHTEHVYILEGAGTMQLGDSTFNIGVGDYIFIPKTTPHKVSVTSKQPVKVLSIQSPKFEGKDRYFLE